MKIEKIRSYVGFAIKAGKAKFGVDNIIDAKKIPFCVLYDEKLGKNSQNKLLNKCKGLTKVFTVDMGFIYPGKNCLAIGISEKNLATAIINEMEENS